MLIADSVRRKETVCACNLNSAKMSTVIISRGGSTGAFHFPFYTIFCVCVCFTMSMYFLKPEKIKCMDFF